jgi:hypothetical protein
VIGRHALACSTPLSRRAHSPTRYNASPAGAAHL